MPQDSASLRAAVLSVLDELRPTLAADGGDIELVAADAERGRVEVRLRGACARCPASTYTLAFGVEARIKQRLPEVREVVAI